jgi:hypothetical protein
LELIKSVFPLRMGIRLVGVTLSNFNSVTTDQEAQLGFL